jgi:uncharacterized protein
MQPSIFNVRVPLENGHVFVINTLTDAQLIVSSDIAALLDRAGQLAFDGGATAEEREALGIFRDNGFLVDDRAADRRALDDYLSLARHSTDVLHVTLLTTLECNFACSYCFQGDHGDYNRHAERMTLDTAARVGDWIERELDRVRPGRFVLQFFGGEPLLNLPVLYALSERLWIAAERRRVPMDVKIITNGLLLTPEIVDRLVPFGLNSIKISLDGDRETHDRMRPLRGGQGTFDRILENVRRVAGRVKVAIGGLFDASTADSFPALLQRLKDEGLADQLANVTFRPFIHIDPPKPQGVIPLTPVGPSNAPLNGTCMTALGSGSGSSCASCDAVDDQTSYLREETRRMGFRTHDTFHAGPCSVHREHAHTIGPDGSLYACPGFTGQLALATGHIDGRVDTSHASARREFDALAPWQVCGDCAFIPVCVGGCVANSHAQLGDMHVPTCHKRTFESALVSLAHAAARDLAEEVVR